MQAQLIELFGEGLGVGGQGERFVERLGQKGSGGIIRNFDIRIIGDDHVRPPGAQGQHQLPEHVFVGLVAVKLVPILHETFLIGAG